MTSPILILLHIYRYSFSYLYLFTYHVSFQDDVARDPVAYMKAMDTLKKGDLVTILYVTTFIDLSLTNIFFPLS